MRRYYRQTIKSEGWPHLEEYPFEDFTWQEPYIALGKCLYYLVAQSIHIIYDRYRSLEMLNIIA